MSSEIMADCDISRAYATVLGIFCIFGMLGNTFSSLIWMRRRGDSPISYILSALSLFDFSVLLFYFLFIAYFYGSTVPDESCKHTLAGMWYVLICFHMYIVSCSLSSWITILLAVFRYITICHQGISKKICTNKFAKLSVLIVFVWVQIASIPFYLYYDVSGLTNGTINNHTSYWIYHTKFAKESQIYQIVLLWLYGIVMKIVPCVFMIFFSTRMIKKVIETNKKKQNNKDRNTGSSKYGRTSVMLIVIVLIYVITALPIGISAFVIGVSGVKELHYFYFLKNVTLSNVINIMQILNCSVNFIVYVLISNKFNRELKNLFRQIKLVLCRCLDFATRKKYGKYPEDAL